MSIWIYVALGVVALILFNVFLLAALRVLDRERDDQDDDTHRTRP